MRNSLSLWISSSQQTLKLSPLPSTGYRWLSPLIDSLPRCYRYLSKISVRGSYARSSKFPSTRCSFFFVQLGPILKMSLRRRHCSSPLEHLQWVSCLAVLGNYFWYRIGFCRRLTSVFRRRGHLIHVCKLKKKKIPTSFLSAARLLTLSTRHFVRVWPISTTELWHLFRR